LTTTLKGISDIRRFFCRNETPIFFIGATNYNLMCIDDWVRNFKFISFIDCYDGRHPNTFVPGAIPHQEFASMEDINNYLLEHKKVIEYVTSRGGSPKACFLMFDEHTEALAKEIGLAICLPPAALRTLLDDKLETVRLGNRGGVPSVPNTLAKVSSFADLRTAATAAGLGTDLVVQTAFGDSGHTTFFIASEVAYQKYAHQIEAESEVKIMRRLRCRSTAVEACTTRRGTIVGPLMTELVGFAELTPYRGGWCGNELFAGAFTPEIRAKARDYALRVGEQLRLEGYRGYFELDFLIEEETGEVFLGEMNPRITGATSLTNHAAFAHADAPLFLFHLLEFLDVEVELDVDEINQRWASADYIDSWSQMVIKHTSDTFDILTGAPQSGLYRLGPEGGMTYQRFDSNWQAVETDADAFFLRISGQGGYRYKGADLGILITRGRLMTADFRLTDRALAWIKAVRRGFSAETPPVETPVASMLAKVPAEGFGYRQVLS
jgi:D-alanine-D-alanine ligase-like ATP-grasp enzyme